MSVLETPRIIFSGEISWDPIVTNNYTNWYNEAIGETVFNPNETVEQFRQTAASSDSVLNQGNWNPQGTHRSNFYNTEITGVDLGGGVQKDSFVTSPVSLSGMLVDCEPYGSYTSQIFFDQMCLGIDGGCRILAPRTSRFTARYINFHRLPRPVYNFAASVASVVWQTSFAKSDGLRIDAYDSAALKALARALKDDTVLGLTVQFNAYSTHYYGAENDSEIAGLEQNFVNNLAGGGFQPNPARSTIVGVVGLWRKGEPPHEPAGRAMLQTSKSQPPKFVASVHARVDADKLTVDLSNSISETDLQQTKQNWGTLSFFAKDAKSGAQTNLGSIDYSRYDRDAYRASGGIVTLPLNSNQAKAATDGVLQMQDQSNIKYLSEKEFRAIPFDPNLYVDSGNTVTTSILVLNKGVPVGKGVKVAMVPDPNQQSTQYYSPPLPPVPISNFEASTNDDGIATFSVDISKWQNGLVQGFVLVPNPTNLSATISPQTTNYMFIRRLPDDVAIGNMPPTWANVYQYCLSNWNAMAPCMDNWLDLKNEAQVKAYSSIIKRLTDPLNFEAFRFMPITRDMTIGERKLLYAFLDGGNVESSGLKTKPVKQAITQAELSRQMRRAK